MCPALLDRAVERRRCTREGTEARREACEDLVTETGPHLAGVAQVPGGLVHAEEQGAEADSAARGIRVAAYDELLPVAALALEPGARAPPGVAAVGALGHHSLKPEAAGLSVEGRAVTRDMLADAEEPGAARQSGAQEVGEARLALGERERAQVLTAREQEVEDHVRQLRVVVLAQRLLQGSEIADSVGAIGDHFAVEQGPVDLELCQLRGERREPRRPVEPVASEKRDVALGDPREDAVAVELDLVRPLVAFGRPDDECGQGKRRLLGWGTAAATFLPAPGTVPAASGGRRVVAGGPCLAANDRGLVTGHRRQTCRGRPSVRRRRRRPGDFLHGAPTRHAAIADAPEVGNARLRVFVPLLDEQPVLAGAGALVRLRGGVHAHEHPSSVEPPTGEAELELAATIARLGVADGLPAPGVPEHHRTAAVFAFGDHPLEAPVLERVILNVQCEAADGRVHAGALRHRPALEHAVHLQAQVPVQLAGGVLVDHEDTAQSALARAAPPPGALRLGGLLEVALLAVCRELAHRRARSAGPASCVPRPSRVVLRRRVLLPCRAPLPWRVPPRLRASPTLCLSSSMMSTTSSGSPRSLRPTPRTGLSPRLALRSMNASRSSRYWSRYCLGFQGASSAATSCSAIPISLGRASGAEMS